MLAKVEAKAAGKPAPPEEPGQPKPKKKRFWLF
jgi:hypothetical protein